MQLAVLPATADTGLPVVEARGLTMRFGGLTAVDGMSIALRLGRTFQIPRPFAEMTVLENVLTGGQRQGGEQIWMNFLRPRRVAAEEKAAIDKARALLDFVTLSALEHEPARVLSGG